MPEEQKGTTLNLLASSEERLKFLTPAESLMWRERSSRHTAEPATAVAIFLHR